MIESKVICDSISEHGKRITTLQVKFHRFILPEFNTHRVFSRNFSSSRAIPTSKLLEQVRTDPAMPIYWGKNKPGMQASEEVSSHIKAGAEYQWKLAAGAAAFYAESLAELGIHKQTVNRIIEPYLWVNGVVTSTEWDNFFELRRHEDAQPEIHRLGDAMYESMYDSIRGSTPTLVKCGEWHLPYVSEEEKNSYKRNDETFLLQKISAARCCRVSYNKHDGTSPSIEDDIALYNRLAAQVPIHASPMEHQAYPFWYDQWGSGLNGNLVGWAQFRKIIENLHKLTEQ